VNIPANGTQSFVVGYTTTGPFASSDVRLGFGCAGVDAAVPVVGLSTLLMTYDANPVADMIAVGLTASNDGFARIPSGGQGAFVTATANIGVTTVLTARARLFDPATPVTATICETVPATGVCKAPPASTVTRSVAASENATWTVFLSATGNVPPDPSKTRVAFEFVDAGGVVRGATSVAVTTQASADF
jgi:hypothetical protein